LFVYKIQKIKFFKNKLSNIHLKKQIFFSLDFMQNPKMLNQPIDPTEKFTDSFGVAARESIKI
jgi:hypothetical protein